MDGILVFPLLSECSVVYKDMFFVVWDPYLPSILQFFFFGVWFGIWTSISILRLHVCTDTIILNQNSWLSLLDCFVTSTCLVLR